MHTIVIIDALRVRDAPHTVWNAKHRRNLNCKMPMFYIRVPFGRESQLPFSHISPVGYFHIFFSRVSKVYFFFLPTYTVRVHSFFGHKFSFHPGLSSKKCKISTITFRQQMRLKIMSYHHHHIHTTIPSNLFQPVSIHNSRNGFRLLKNYPK